MQEYVFVIQTDALPGREDEYNDWYNNVHVHDVVKVPGIIAARRYTLSDIQRRELPPDQAKYMAIYNIETDDLAHSMQVLGERSGTAVMPRSEAMVRRSAVVYRPIGPLVGRR